MITAPQEISRERETLLRLFGAKVDVVESMGGMTEAVESARAGRRRRRLDADQFASPASPAIHRKTTGPELLEQLDGRLTSSSPASVPVARSPASGTR